MSRKSTYLLLLAMCALLLTSLPATFAQEGESSGQAFNRVGDARPARGTANVAPSGTITALIQLQGDPAAAYLAYQPRGSASAALAAETQAVSLESQHQSFAANLQSQFPGVRYLYNLKWLNSAIVVTMDASLISQVEAMPGVLGVYPDILMEQHHDTSVPFIGSPAAWASTVDGLTGEGMRIGIVDSGIDYFHANFGGSGDPLDFTNNDPLVITDAGFPNDRVVGGFDFVGDGWTGGGGNPDPDPIDCAANGHGSHVAGSAAGNGVNMDGTPYTGTYDDTVPFDTMLVAPGVAPEADLYAFKTGDCTPSISLVGSLAAWDMGLDPNGDGSPDDRLHVINNSWGGRYAGLEDLVNRQADLAVAAGMSIVFSAGNAGDIYYIQDTVGDGVITVASSLDPGAGAATVSVNSPFMNVYEAGTASFGPALDETGITGDITLVLDTNGAETGCVATAQDLTGQIALIRRGVCPFATKVLNAQNAGAIGAIIQNNSLSGAPGLGGADPSVTIPSVGISFGNGEAIRNAGGTVNVTLSLADGTDTASGFTSRGPRVFDGVTLLMKPDISAPGTNIISAEAGSGIAGVSFSGTSMAAPHVAGAVALAHQANPTWDPYQIKALVMNTATNDVTDLAGNLYGTSRVGTGRLDVSSAAVSDVIAYNSMRRDQVSLSFGMIEVVGTFTGSMDITVANFGADAASYDVSTREFTSVPGVTFSVSPPTINVPAGGTATVTLTLDATAADMAFVPKIGTELSDLRRFLSEATGVVELTATSMDENLRVGYHSFPRPASNMATTAPIVEITPDMSGLGSLTLDLEGTGMSTIDGSPAPYDVFSVVTAYEMTADDTCGDLGDPTFYNAQWVTDALDIEYVGAATGNDGADDWVFFAITTCSDWLETYNYEYDIDIDVNGDFTPDLTVFNYNADSLAGDAASDQPNVWVSIYGAPDPMANGVYFPFVPGTTIPVPANMVPPTVAETYLYNNNVMFFPVPVSLLELAGYDPMVEPVINFDAYSIFYSIVGPQFMDFVGGMSYNPTTPAYTFTGGDATLGTLGLANAYADDPATDIGIDFDLSVVDGAPDILLLHHHNAGVGQRAEKIQVTVAPDAFVAGPTEFAVFGDLEDAPVNPSFYWEHRTSDTDPSRPGDWYNVVIWDASFNILMNEWYEAAAFCEGPICEVPTGPSVGSFFDDALPYGIAAGDYNWGVSFWSASTGSGPFTIAPDSFTAAGSAPTGVTISVPMDGETLVGNDVSVTFTADPDAAYYNVDITGPETVNEWYFYTDICGGASCSVDFDFYTDGDYEVTVTAWNADATGLGVASTAVAFTLDNVAADVIVQTAPMAGDTLGDDAGESAILSFEWDAAPSAEWYNLVVVNSGGSVVANEWVRCLGSACGYDSIYLLNGTYTWYIAGYSNEGGVGDYGSGSTFTLAYTAPGEVGLVSPVDGVIYNRGDLTVAFENNGSSWYQLYVGDPVGATAYFDWFRSDTALSGQYIDDFNGPCFDVVDGEDAGICEIDMELPVGNYQVYMRSYNPAGVGPWTTTPLSFTVE